MVLLANSIPKRWIFIIEGIFTCFLAVAAFWYISEWPSKAKFINEDERAFVNDRLKDDSDATQNEIFTWSNVLEALKDPKVWLYNVVFHTLNLPLYTLSLFLVRTSYSKEKFSHMTDRAQPSHQSSKPSATHFGKPNSSPSLPTPSQQSSQYSTP